jgi:hypothetical protein
MTDDALVKLATRAYLYGYPMNYGLEEIAKFPNGNGTVVAGATPFNTFGVRDSLCGPDTKFVTPNNDTIYMIAPLDFSAGPLLVEVPDTGDRYYVLQCIDAWSNNFAYVGKRATGTKAGTYLFTPPGWSGEVPAGVTATVEAPTEVCIIAGRLQIDGPAENDAVQALARQFTITPLEPAKTLAGIPAPSPGVGDDLVWWETFRVSLQAFPPPPADADLVEAFAPLGLTATESPYVSPDADLAAALVAGAKAGEATIEQLMMNIHATPEGWQNTLHLFDYNTESLRLGTIDTPEWKIADRDLRYATRAVVARAGLWGNHGYEADYAIVWIDDKGDKFDGAHRYELHLPTPPPVDAFWSLTMYDVPDFYLVANEIDRYSIGDRTPGLRYGTDGSLTISLQHDRPEGDQAANWLPAPAGPFRPVMRMYQPGAAILDGSYTLPAVTRVD